jgi:arylsulfatase A-like enzyme/tetratricopeptide (TPR) repeat protein
MKKPILAIAAAVLVTAVAFGAWRWRATGGPVRAEGPVILISIDTLRADRLPAYGYGGTSTPNIDRLVADGVLFENAYSHSPQTLPAHTSILTGRLPFEHGVRDNVGFAVKPGERTLQQTLREHGFSTGGFVSAYVLRRQVGFDQGFDHYDDELPPASPEKPLGQMQRGGLDTFAAASRWLDARTAPKFFLFFHIYEPHRPYTPPAHIKAGNPYDGEVEYADEIVGKLLDHLRTKGQYDDATIILLSDHGEGLGDHGEDEHGIFLYRETIRVPLVIKLPGSAGAGKRVAAPVQHVDIFPTVLDLFRLKAEATSNQSGQAEGTQGRSLLPALTGTGSLAATNIYSESLSPRYHFGWSELYALSDDRYRLVRAPKDELYDLTQDPGELKSIAAERGQIVGAMRSALDGMIAGATVTAPSSVSDEDRQKLAALGYVGTQTGSALQLPGDRLPDPKDRIGVLRRYKHATDLAGARRFDEAIVAYRELLKEEPGMTDVWLQLADMYNRRGSTMQAVDAYKEVVKRNPKDAAGLTGAAAGLLRLRKLDEARAHAELAVDTAPAAAHELLARIAVESRDEASARRHAQLAREADPTLPLPPFIEGVLLHAQQQYAPAAAQLLEARNALDTRTVQLPDVNYYLADSLARLERYPEAERYFRAEISLFPAHVRARAGLAMLFRAMGRDRESEQVIAELIRTVPTREGYDVAAQLWTMFGEPQKAAELRALARRSQ